MPDLLLTLILTHPTLDTAEALTLHTLLTHFLPDPSPIIQHHTSAQSSHHTTQGSTTLLSNPVTNAQSHYNIMRVSADIAKLSPRRANMPPYHGVLCDRNTCDKAYVTSCRCDFTMADDVIRLGWANFYDALRELKLRCY